MYDEARLHTRPWPVDPAEHPLNPSDRATGPAYCPPPVKKLSWRATYALWIVFVFSTWAALIALGMFALSH